MRQRDRRDFAAFLFLQKCIVCMAALRRFAGTRAEFSSKPDTGRFAFRCHCHLFAKVHSLLQKLSRLGLIRVSVR
jgi:hypothetical protein